MSQSMLSERHIWADYMQHIGNHCH